VRHGALDRVGDSSSGGAGVGCGVFRPVVSVRRVWMAAACAGGWRGPDRSAPAGDQAGAPRSSSGLKTSSLGNSSSEFAGIFRATINQSK